MLPLSQRKAFSPKDLEHREWWLDHCRDLFFFETVVLGHAWPDRYHDFGPVQRKMCNFLNTRVTPSRKKYLSAFRSSFKSTVLEGAMAYEFAWARQEGRPLGLTYNTATKENSSLFSYNVRYNLLNNPLLQWIFWPNLPQDSGGYDSFTKGLVRLGHVKLEFSSFDTIQVGRHSPIMINDDLENDTNAYSDLLRNELIDKWKHQKAILTKIASRGVGLEIDIGTPYHFQGLMWKIRHLKSYDKLIVPCWTVDDQGKRHVTMPELYTEQDFLEKLEEMGPAIFSAQYLLHPLAEEDALCNPRWLRYYTVLPMNAWRSMVIDPGGSDPKTKDATGISIVDTDEKGDMYIVYYKKLWLAPVELMDTINRLKEEFRPDDIRIEKDRYATTIADTFRHRFPLLHVSFVEHKKRDKGQRIWRLKQWLQTGRIYIHPDNKEVETDLLQYPHLDWDDGLDSLAYHLDIRRVPPKIIKPRFEAKIECTFDEEFDKFVGRFRDRNERRTAGDSIY